MQCSRKQFLEKCYIKDGNVNSNGYSKNTGNLFLVSHNINSTYLSYVNLILLFSCTKNLFNFYEIYKRYSSKINNFDIMF